MDMNVTLVLGNPRCLRALRHVCRFVWEMADRYEYDSDAQLAKRAAKHLAKNLKLELNSDQKVITGMNWWGHAWIDYNTGPFFRQNFDMQHSTHQFEG